MAILKWVLRILVFLLLVGFASRNSDPVTVYGFFGYEWRVELSLLLLLFLSSGAALGAFAGWTLARGTRPETARPQAGNAEAD